MRKNLDGRPRDNQRSKVYASELETFPFFSRCFITKKGIIDFLTSIMNDSYVCKKYGTLGNVDIQCSGNRPTHTFYYKGKHRIRLPYWSWSKYFILHEIAHAYVMEKYDGKKKVAGHGSEFCTVYLDLISHFVGENAAKTLAREFIKRKVNFRGLEWR